MRNLMLATVSVLAIFMVGCKPNPQKNVEKLISFAASNDLGVEAVFMEMRGTFFTDRWYKVTLYFGYGDNENWNTCVKDANLLNIQDRPNAYRCVLARS